MFCALKFKPRGLGVRQQSLLRRGLCLLMALLCVVCMPAQASGKADGFSESHEVVNKVNKASAASNKDPKETKKLTEIGMASPIHQDWQLYLKRYALQYAWVNDQQRLLQLSDADPQHYHMLLYGQNSWGNERWGSPIYLPVVSTYHFGFLHFHGEKKGINWSGVLSLSPYSRMAYADFPSQVFQSGSLGLMMHKTLGFYRVDSLITVGASYFHKGILQSDLKLTKHKKKHYFVLDYQALLQVVRDFSFMHDALILTPGIRYQYDLMRLYGVSSQWQRIDVHVSMNARLDDGLYFELTSGVARMRFRTPAPSLTLGYHQIKDSWQLYTHTGIEARINDRLQCVVQLGGAYTLNGLIKSTHFGVLVNYQW